MSRTAKAQLLAEQEFLKSRLERLPPAGLTRRSVEARLRSVSDALSSSALDGFEPAKVRLTFRGRPVVGSHGIFADFGAKAVSSFNEAVSTVAASLSATLAATGPVPNREQYQLIVTGSAVGSFGFELEEYRGEQLPLDEATPVAQALERTAELLKSTLGTDEELAESASDADPRALDKVRIFLQTLADSDAVCTMEHGAKSFRFDNVGQVRNSLARLSRENLSESEERLSGEFQGFLPKGRTCEFYSYATQEIIRCKVPVSIKNAADINRHLYEHTTIDVMVTRVGSGRPRYALIAMPQWTDGEMPR